MEGLCVSYFLRASKMYDTLMQMGRWFGYRSGYLDVCRLYTTADLVEWFEHIADAAEELRGEFDYMMNSGLTPRDYGLKVKSHPVLMVTSPLKMRTAKSLYLSFSGDLVETVSFYKDKTVLEQNLRALESLIAELGPAMSIPSQERNGRKDSWNGAQWENVAAEQVVGFLRDYRTHPDSRKVRSEPLADFIGEMALSGELKTWTVAVVGGGVSREPADICGLPVKRMRRKNKALAGDDKYSIGRLLSPQDEGLGMDERAWNAALEMTKKNWKPDSGRAHSRELPEVPSGPYIRRVRGYGADGVLPQPERGLLLLYLLDPQDSGVEGVDIPVVAFAISFPSSRAGKSVPYMVTSQLWEQEYGGSE